MFLFEPVLRRKVLTFRGCLFQGGTLQLNVSHAGKSDPILVWGISLVLVADALRVWSE